MKQADHGGDGSGEDDEGSGRCAAQPNANADVAGA